MALYNLKFHDCCLLARDGTTTQRLPGLGARRLRLGEARLVQTRTDGDSFAPALGFAIQTYHDDFAEAAKVQRAVGFKPGDAVIVDNIQGAFLKEHPGIFPGVSVLGASFALWDEKMKAEVFKSFEWFRTCPPRTGAGAGAAE